MTTVTIINQTPTTVEVTFAVPDSNISQTRIINVTGLSEEEISSRIQQHQNTFEYRVESGIIKEPSPSPPEIPEDE